MNACTCIVCADCTIVKVAESGIAEPSSSSLLVCCVHFALIPLEKVWIDFFSPPPAVG